MNLDEKYQLLKKWILDNNGFINEKLDFTYINNENRYIVSNNDINPEELLFSIPDKLCINNKLINDIPNINNINIDNLDINSIMILILKYHFSLGENSFYYPYLNLLPSYEDYNYHPLYKYNDELGKKWRTISNKIVDMIESQIRIIDKIFDNFTKLGINITYQEVKYYYMIIITRQWTNVGLVPFADLLQHSNSSNLLLNTNNNSHYIKNNNNGIMKNQIIYDNYGLYDDNILFTNFGFVDQINNTQLSRFIKIPIINNIKNDTPFNRLRLTELNSFKSKHFILSNNFFDKNILYQLRLYSLTLSDIKSIDISTTFYNQVISISNEKESYLSLFKILKNLISSKSDIKSIMNNINDYHPDSIEYKISSLVLFENEIIRYSINMLLYEWIKLLGCPFNLNLKVLYD